MDFSSPSVPPSAMNGQGSKMMPVLILLNIELVLFVMSVVELDREFSLIFDVSPSEENHANI